MPINRRNHWIIGVRNINFLTTPRIEENNLRKYLKGHKNTIAGFKIKRTNLTIID